MQGIQSALSAAAPLLMGLSQDVLAGPRSTGQGFAQGLQAFQQGTARQKQEDQARKGIMGAIKAGSVDPKVARLAQTMMDSGDPQGAYGLIQKAGLAQATAKAEDPWSGYKVVGNSVLGIGPDGPTVAYQGKKAERDRQIITGADGRKYFVDSGELALPGVTPKPSGDRFKVVGGDLVDVTASGGPAAVYEGRDSGPKPNSAIAKLKQDFDNGLIDRETFVAARAKALSGQQFEVETADGTVVRYGGGANVPVAVTTEALKGKNAFESIMTGLDDFERLVQDGGGAVLPGVRKDAMDETRRGLQLQMKELFNLGVLNGPDLALMDQLLVDPTSLTNNALDALGLAGIEERNEANVARLRKLMTDLIKPKLEKIGEAPPGAVGVETPALGRSRTINGASYEFRDGRWMTRK